MSATMTTAHTAVREALRRQDRYVTAAELHVVMQDSPSPVGIATVYRALRALADEGQVDVL